MWRKSKLNVIIVYLNQSKSKEGCNQEVTHIESEIEKLQSTVSINRELIIEALTNFDDIFEEATKEKSSLLRALIKEIHVEADRKSV